VIVLVPTGTPLSARPAIGADRHHLGHRRTATRRNLTAAESPSGLFCHRGAARGVRHLLQGPQADNRGSTAAATGADQRAIVKAISRATRYATQHGIVVVAAAVNEATDLATRRPTSSASTSTRRGGYPGCRHQCVVLAAELPGVATVSGVGPQGILAFSSNLGNAWTNPDHPH
jgi:hypothetical protein